MGELNELGPSECRALLGDHQIGRVAVVAPDGPHIIPVNYALVDETVILRTSPLSLVATLGRNASVAFEVDHLDQVTHTGWSVVVTGEAHELTGPDALAEVAKLRLRPWTPGPKSRYVRIVPDHVEGRRIVHLADGHYRRTS